MLHKAYLLLGSNRGDRSEMLLRAVEHIGMKAGKITAASNVYESTPWGFNDETNFLNQAICIETSLSPNDLLTSILQIEAVIGRIRTGKSYSGRIIDIDILFYDDQVIDSDVLQVPHPRMQDRLFTLLPLSEIAGNLLHPVFMTTINELILTCSDNLEVRLYDYATAWH